MIRKDFEDSGFPICKRAPVLCFSKSGDVHIAYNHYALKRILEEHDILQCMGIWPGKRNTDCFPLNPDEYAKYAPPEKHRDIVDAEEIKVHRGKDGKHLEICYTMRDNRGNCYDVVSQEPELYQYLAEAGLRYKTLYV